MDTQPPPADYYTGLLSMLLQATTASNSNLIYYAIVSFLLICSALMAGAEVAFFSLATKELTLLRNKYKSSANNIILLLEQPRKLLATILIANSFVNIGIVICTYAIINSYNIQSAWLKFLIEIVAVTFVLVLFGEVLPKVYASQRNVRVCLFMVTPLKILSKMFAPLSFILISFTNIIEKKLLSKKQGEIDTDEINHAIDLALHDKTSKQEVSILKGIAKFGTISVKQIMKARPDIVATDYTKNFKELIHFVNEVGYSRIPIYQEDIDSIKGILFTKDLLEHFENDENFNWHELIRPPFFVPEHKKIDDLLKEFKELRIHLAIIVDEYGATAGLVTLEDIMEEIIGDIKDEFDEGEEFNYQKINDNTFVFEGKMLMNDVCRVLNIPTETFDEVKGESDTIAGLFLELFGKIPKFNESAQYKQFKLTVQQMNKMRIAKLKVEISPVTKL